MSEITIRLAEPLRQCCGGQAVITLTPAPATVGEALLQLTSRCPEAGSELIRADGRLRAGLVIFINDDDSRYRGGLEATLAPGDMLSLLPPCPL
jgi:molybdopterin converting factor small subunit